jgi:hypothetical protein
MKLLRGVAAILALLTGLIMLASALSLAITAAIAAQTHQPIDFAAVVVGLVASAIGILC